jgi:hypothetical protein
MQLAMKIYHDRETSMHKQLNQLMLMVDDDVDDSEHDYHCRMLHVHQ